MLLVISNNVIIMQKWNTARNMQSMLGEYIFEISLVPRHLSTWERGYIEMKSLGIHIHTWSGILTKQHLCIKYFWRL